MISQHLITRPVFQALFANAAFLTQNPVSQAMEKLLGLLDQTTYEKDQKDLHRFYDSVKLRCEGIETAEGRQSVIAELYGTFFQVALKKEVERLGIVYTPVEVVDFINQSVADLMEKEFGRTLSDRDVHIIDPFTGTGTFLVRLMQQGLIRPEALREKYLHELHANEIVLLAYYIASVNIETACHDLIGEDYLSFPGICLTDTFELYEKTESERQELSRLEDPYLGANSRRADDQRRQPMRVIIGNPPYSAKQTSANDNAQNEIYPLLEARIAETYAAGTSATNKNALYDSYIKSFRWASDRLGPAGGVIGFVTNAGWLTGQAMDGLRKCFEKEFSSIYVYNLRGNTRTIGERARKEGGQIFGSGSRTPIAITLLVKDPAAAGGKARIYYREMVDYMSRTEKLAAVKAMKSAAAPSFPQRELHPNDYGDWLDQRSETFPSFPAMQPAKKFDAATSTLFTVNSRGFETGRDAWVYNYSLKNAQENVHRMIGFYNSELSRWKDSPIKAEKLLDFVDKDPQKISWTSSLIQTLNRKRTIEFISNAFRISLYRPFCQSWLYSDSMLIHRIGQMLAFFPTEKQHNLVICVPGSGDLTCIITDKILDLNALGAGAQCFPLYWYEKKVTEGSLFDAAQDDAYVRHDGVSDWALREARAQYGDSGISKEDIFFYVYGFLHSPDYRTQFAADLTKSLPRVPFVDRAEDFAAFRDAGRALAELHLHYEDRPAPEGVVIEKRAEDYTVEKMRFGRNGKEKDKSVIFYNDAVTLRDIPPEVYGYVVNGRSAVEWVMERYRVMTDKASGIRNAPNDWARERDDPQYILRLLLSVMTVSLRTMDIVRSLPKLDLKKRQMTAREKPPLSERPFCCVYSLLISGKLYILSSMGL